MRKKNWEYESIYEEKKSEGGGRGRGIVQDEDGYYFFGFDESGEILLFFLNQSINE